MIAPAVPNSKTDARDHQKEAFWFAFNRRAAMLAIAMRGGKSKITVDLVVNRGHRRTIILCPSNVVDTWPGHFYNHAGRRIEVLALGPKSGKLEERTKMARKAFEETEGQLVIVAGYEMATMAPFGPTLERGKTGRLTWKAPGFLLSADWDFAVADEIHHWKASGGLGRRIGTRLGARVPYRLGLTGTPFAQKPLDIWGQFMFLDPSVFGESYQEFQQKYAVMNPQVKGKVSKYINLDDFETKFKSIAYVVTKEDIKSFVQTAEPTFIRHRVPLDEEGERVYNELVHLFLADLGEGLITPKNVMVRLLRLQQLTGGTLETDGGERVRVDESKARNLARILRDLPQCEAVVVFARFRSDLDAIKEVAEAQGRRYAELSGRKRGLQLWQSGGADVLGVQTQAGREGLELVRGTHAVYYSLGFSLTDFLQSLERLQGTNQQGAVTYHFLIATIGGKDSVDTTVLESLRKYQAVSDSLLKRTRGKHQKEEQALIGDVVGALRKAGE